MAKHPLVEFLRSQLAQELIADIDPKADPIRLITDVRKQHPDLSAEQVSAVVTQARLRAKAVSRFGPTTWLLTEDGLAQASRPEASAFRVRLAKQLIPNLREVVDLTCGLGFDAAAFAAAGLEVTAIERDEEVCAFARANLGSALCADAQEFDIPAATDLVFLDPARRDPQAAKSLTGETRRIANPNQWSPPWPFIEQLACEHRVMVKAAPGIEVPPGWDAWFVSVSGDLVETLLVSGGTGNRTAVLLNDEKELQIPSGDQVSAGPIGRFLLIPDPALIRTHALDWLAKHTSAHLVHHDIAWLTTNDEQAVAQQALRGARVLEILQVLPLDEKVLRKAVAERSASAVTIMTRGVQLDVETLRRKVLRKPGSGPEVVLAVFRSEPSNQVLLCRRRP